MGDSLQEGSLVPKLPACLQLLAQKMPYRYFIAAGRQKTNALAR